MKDSARNPNCDVCGKFVGRGDHQGWKQWCNETLGGPEMAEGLVAHHERCCEKSDKDCQECKAYLKTKGE